VKLSVRQLTADDAQACRQLGWEAFGLPDAPPSEPASIDRPGATYYGAFDDGSLVARMVDRAYDSCFGGALVATSGIAGVTVVAEYRGQGALGPLFAQTLAAARSRGALISTLFPTAPRIYRKFGYEVVADYVTVEVPTSVLASVPQFGSVSTRRADATDFDAVQEVYDAWAIEQNGPLSRRGVSFTATAERFISSFTGVTLAIDASEAVVGFASWKRGQGYGAHAAMAVCDLLATTSEGYRALLAAIGSFASVCPTTKIDTSGDDLARMFLPSLHWTVAASSPYMLKIIAVAAAFAARPYPPGIYAQLGFRLAGDFLADNDGTYLLQIADGQALCTRGMNHDDRTLSPQGLALTYAGTQSCANLRFAGHLNGGDPAQDPLWDALFGGRQQHIRDYF
jgi:predicted acetyltransferase